MAELKRHFRPEFLNRVDDVIIFQSLDESEIERIVDIQLEKLKKRSRNSNSRWTWTLPRKSCWPRKATTRNSARPLKRAVQEHILNRFRCACSKGNSNRRPIKVTAKNDELVFEKK